MKNTPKEKERPYWFPVLTDEAWIARIRADYPEDTESMGDDEVKAHYADGRKYADVWDHIGDAQHDYEKLADSFLELLQALKGMLENSCRADWPADLHDAARAAIAKAEGSHQ